MAVEAKPADPPFTFTFLASSTRFATVLCFFPSTLEDTVGVIDKLS